MINSRYPNITPLNEASLFHINNYMENYPSPDSPSIPYTPFMNMNINTPNNMNSTYCSPNLFSSSFESEPMSATMANYTIPSNVQPFSPLRISQDMFMNSPTFSVPSPTNHFEFDQQNQQHWEISSNAAATSPSMPSSYSVDEKLLDIPQNLISREPTPRALKAKRCPTNKCPCGGKEDCNEPGCIKSAGHFVCPVCNIEFSRKNSMRRHVLTHINLRPYECKTCQKSFYRSDIYKRHLSSKKCRKNVSQLEMLSLINQSNNSSMSNPSSASSLEFNRF